MIKLTKIVVMLALFFVFTHSAHAENIGANWTPAKVLATKVIDTVSISPDASKVLYTTLTAKGEKRDRRVRRWVADINIYDIKERSTITLFKQNEIFSAQWFPDSTKIAFLCKGEKFQAVWSFDLTTQHKYKILEVATDIFSFKFSPDGKYIAFVTNDLAKVLRNDDGLRVVDIEDKNINSRIYLFRLKARKKIVPLTSPEVNIFMNQDFNWSPDSNFIVFAYQPDKLNVVPIHTKLAVINIKNKSIRCLKYTEKYFAFWPLFSHDSVNIAFGAGLAPISDPRILYTDPNSGTKVCVENLFNGQSRCLPNTSNENSVPIGWSLDDSEIYLADLYKTEGPQLYAVKLDGTSSVRKITQTDGYIDFATISLNPKNNLLAFAYESIRKPGEVFLSNIKPYSLRQISTIQKGVNPFLGKVKLITWLSDDNAPIEGLLYLPSNYNNKRIYPVVVFIHGGPSENVFKLFVGGTFHRGQKTAPFCVQDYLDKGFLVFEPNFRDSNGYGSAFRMMGIGNLGRLDYQDVMSGVNYLVKNKIADPDHLALFGWSFGGYLVSWMITQTHAFKAAVEGAGYTDLISYSSTTNIPKFLQAYFLQPFWLTSYLYLERSPIMFTKNIKTPLLIIHGENDQKISITQGYELYSALKQQNKPVKMLVMPGQGHLPTDPNIIMDSMRTTESWLVQVLKK